MWTARFLCLPVVLSIACVNGPLASAFVPYSSSRVATRPTLATFQLSLSTTTPTDHTIASTTPSPSPAPSPTSNYQCDVPPFNNVMAANRAEIAVRIMRAATELNIATTAIYVDEDKFSQHRWGADKSFKLDKGSHPGATPISAYLDIPQIIKVAKQAHVDAIHPVSDRASLSCCVWRPQQHSKH
jgi:hypothetical protein